MTQRLTKKKTTTTTYEHSEAIGKKKKPLSNVDIE
jgi:hypothetical protein